MGFKQQDVSKGHCQLGQSGRTRKRSQRGAVFRLGGVGAPEQRRRVDMRNKQLNFLQIINRMKCCHKHVDLLHMSIWEGASRRR